MGRYGDHILCVHVMTIIYIIINADSMALQLMGTTASLTLGVSVGAAFALMIVVLVAAYCIYTYKHPEKRPGHAGKVKPNNLAKMSKYKS